MAAIAVGLARAEADTGSGGASYSAQAFVNTPLHRLYMRWLPLDRITPPLFNGSERSYFAENGHWNNLTEAEALICLRRGDSPLFQGI